MVRRGVRSVTRGRLATASRAAARRARSAARTCAAVGALALLLLFVACDKPAPTPGNDTATVPPPPPQAGVTPPPAVDAPWDSAGGAVFLAIGPSATTAAVIFPGLASDAEVESAKLDAQPYRGSAFDLLANGRVVGQATVSSVVPADAPEECSGWPLVQLSDVGADTASRSWVVGFQRGRMIPIAYDSIAALPSADSSRLAMEVARLASGLPYDTVSSLRGIPYQVRRAYRFTLAPGVEGLVAEVLRTLNQEANPTQEHLLVVAERDSLSRGRWDVSYSERAAGGEELLESSELLAIGRYAPTREAVVLLARYVGDGVVYALLERTGSRRWRLRWTSPYVGC